MPIKTWSGTHPEEVTAKANNEMIGCRIDYLSTVKNDRGIAFDPAMKIAQLVLLPFMSISQVEEGIVDRSTDRGDGGFGSTGR